MFNDQDTPIIIPAIMPKDYQDFEFKAGMVDGVVTRVQIDIMDGKFVPSLSWPFLRPSKGTILNADESIKAEDHLDRHFREMQAEEKGLPCWSTLDYDVDLMVDNPAKAVDEWAKVGVTRVILHLREKNMNDVAVAIEVAKERMLEISLALPPIDITPAIRAFIFEKHLSDISGIQCMGIDKVGYQGENFNPKTFTVIKTIIDELHAHNAKQNEGAKEAGVTVPEKRLEISVDGGVTHENARPLYDAGVDKLVSGSVIFESDSPRQAIEFFDDVLRG